MKKYFIDYQTGAGNFAFTGTLENAMKEADKGAAYTQQNIKIRDYENQEKVYATRYWNGVRYEKNDEEQEETIIDFGFGYYADWIITE